VKAVAVKPSSSGHFRYRFSPRLAEQVLCGNVTRVNVPLRFAGPVRTATDDGFQVVERHLYLQAQSKRLVAYYPSRRLGLVAREREFWDGKSVPQAEPIRFVAPGTDPKASPYVAEMDRRCPSDMRAWSTRLWGEVRSATRTDVQSLTTRQKYESGARLSGLRFHPGQTELIDRAFRGLWNRAWEPRGLSYESNPAVMSLTVAPSDRSYEECVSREVGGRKAGSNLQGVKVA